MDPDATVVDILRIAAKIEFRKENNLRLSTEECTELAQKIIDLDNWIRSSGFLPKCWNIKNRKRKNSV